MARMDRGEAADSLAEIQRREAQTLDAATRDLWPWWYVVGVAVLMIAFGAALDVDEIAALLPCGLGWFALSSLLARRSRVRLRRSVAARTVWFTGTLLLGILATYAAARAVLQYALDLPWPSTLAMAVAAVLFVGLSPLLRRAYRATLSGGRR